MNIDLHVMSLVSIVIPVWNVEAYLPFCLDSITNQTYKNLEIILIDDGSTDSSGSICDDAAAKDRRIKVIHKKNEGLSAARNTGLNEAKGKWLVFVDSDDYVDRNYISALVQAILVNRSDIASCRYRVVSEYKIEEIKYSNICKTLEGKEAVKELLSEKKSSTSAWGKLAATEKWKQCCFPEARKYEDLPVTWKLFDGASTVSLIDEPLYYYVKRDESITQTPSLQSAVDYDKSIQQIYREITAKYEDCELSKCLSFRCCLEYCRLLEMLGHITLEKDYEMNIVHDINERATKFIKEHRFSAFTNKYASIMQRVRIVLTSMPFANRMLQLKLRMHNNIYVI